MDDTTEIQLEGTGVAHEIEVEDIGLGIIERIRVVVVLVNVELVVNATAPGKTEAACGHAGHI